MEKTKTKIGRETRGQALLQETIQEFRAPHTSDLLLVAAVNSSLREKTGCVAARAHSGVHATAIISLLGPFSRRKKCPWRLQQDTHGWLECKPHTSVLYSPPSRSTTKTWNGHPWRGGGCGNLGVRAGMFDCELTSEVEMSIALNIQLESFPDKK